MTSYLDSASESHRKKITIATLAGMRTRAEKIAVLTCYDASFAAIMDQSGIDALLIGDSLGMVIQGHHTTLPVTLADVCYHTACVARASRAPLLMADMPFGSYVTPELALQNAVKVMQAGAEIVKLEGGEWLAPVVRMLVERGIPVCAHLGLTPQSVHQLGGFRVQGKTDAAADQLLADALALQAAGASLLVLEAIPSALAERVTGVLQIPTIGIGAGPNCSGQVLVMHDMLGAFPGHRPKFVRNFMESQADIAGAFRAYVAAVKDGSFPATDHSF
jgi:3-methyl-2-oxobutanoate hydroxymethyltransferase